MARCQCAGSSCGCAIEAGPGVQVQGVGSANQPYVVTSSPNFHETTFTNVSPIYYVNAPGYSDVGTNAVFVVEINPSVLAFINLPDGTSNSPYPPVGTELNFIISGDTVTSNINWSGPVITWHGTAPSATKTGWYRFIFLGTRWAGQYLGASYVI